MRSYAEILSCPSIKMVNGRNNVTIKMFLIIFEEYFKTISRQNITIIKTV